MIYLGGGLYYISPQLGYVPTQRVPRPLMCSTPVSAPVSAFHCGIVSLSALLGRLTRKSIPHGMGS